MVFFIPDSMKNRFVRSLVLLCIFLSFGITRVFGFSSETATYTFRYAPEKTGTHGTTNFFIRELARYNMTTLPNTSFTYHYADTRKIEKPEPYTYQVTIAFSETNCSGDIYYRGFNIADILEPEIVDFELIVVQNGNHIHKETFSEVRAMDQAFSVTSVFENLDDSGNFDVLVSDVSFYSDDSDRDRFAQRINFIDSYYASIEAMDIISAELSAMKYLPGQLIKNLMKVHEAERIFKAVGGSEFNRALHLDDQDVAGYRAKSRQFQIKMETARERLQRNMNAVDTINPSQTVEMIAQTYVEEISRFFFRSQSVSHTLQSYYFGLGYVEFNASHLSSLQRDLDEIIRKSGYSRSAGFAVKNFKTAIFQSFVTQAKYFLEKEQFNVAKGILINGSKFYQAAYGGPAPVELNILMSKSNYGIYNSYLHLINRAVDIGNYGLAENYMEKATRFQAENTSTIISNNHIVKLTEKLADLYISKGFNLLAEDEFKEAIYCFEQAHQLCFSIQLFNHDYLIKQG
jgi:tetratricopeptide (TPR) repeat protein